MAIDWSIVLYFCIVVVIFPLLIVYSLWRYRSIKCLMEQQAVKRSGIVVGTFLLPLLKFSYRTLPVVVTSVPRSKYRHAKTEVGITLLKPAPSDITILKESVATRLGKALGATDLVLGNEEFDREFLIKTQDESFARNFVNFTLQNTLLEMLEEKPRITLEGTWVTVQVPTVIKTEEGYDQLLTLAFALVDRLYDL